ncbi:MAG: pyruvate dehydrogenase [Rhodothermales bacterium]|nr:pyruvate dehydrogenase [Rhodothermales bacterium]
MTARESEIATIDWTTVLRNVLISRRLDDLEETKLVPEKKVLYQFSARGHEFAQSILGQYLNRSEDGISAYYRSRPLMLSLGLSVEDALAAPMARSGSFSDGRDIGVVCNMPAQDNRPTVLPMSGDVGSQFTPAAGWAQALLYKRNELNDDSVDGAIAIAMGGDASVATNGFWSSLTMATTLSLPLLFFIEDNGYGISVPSHLQTPGANIASNLQSFANLKVLDGSGTDPEETSSLIEEAVLHVRSWKGPALLRVTVPRLSGHSGQDNQAYKSDEILERERRNDPLDALRSFLVPNHLSEDDWSSMEDEVQEHVQDGFQRAEARPLPDPSTVKRYVFSDAGEPQQSGGLRSSGSQIETTFSAPKPEPGRINLIAAVRRTLESELATNPRLLVFGEDVGPKGGVHAGTAGLQERFGEGRVFDTSLSEEGIIGRAVGMALAGLMPAPEIQFRKYADPATEQLNNCGTIRWRTANRFAAPIVVRMPGGFAKVGDPWHSVSGEVVFAHAVGWYIAMPSNAEDAVGLFRTALRGDDPVIFFEHRALIDAASARRSYPGDEFCLPFGVANTIQTGNDLTIITWGAMVDRCARAIEQSTHNIELIDLRTIMPWDKEACTASVRKTKRCLIVHEDAMTGGFGAEIAATLVDDVFFDLDAPVKRLAVPDVPIPHNTGLMSEVVPTVELILETANSLIEF